jgi:hypothetical protein
VTAVFIKIRRRLENNNKIDLRETGYEDVGWSQQAENGAECRAFLNTVMNLRVPRRE